MMYKHLSTGSLIHTVHLTAASTYSSTPSIRCEAPIHADKSFFYTFLHNHLPIFASHHSLMSQIWKINSQPSTGKQCEDCLYFNAWCSSHCSASKFIGNLQLSPEHSIHFGTKSLFSNAPENILSYSLCCCIRYIIANSFVRNPNFRQYKY